MEPVEDLVQLKISSVSQWVKWFAKQRNKKVPQVQSFSCWRFFRSFPGSKQLTHLEQDLLNIKLRFYILSQRFFKETSRRGSCSLFAHIFFPISCTPFGCGRVVKKELFLWCEFSPELSRKLTRVPLRGSEVMSSTGYTVRDFKVIKKVPISTRHNLYEQKPGWLGSIGDYTTQVYRDYNKP